MRSILALVAILSLGVALVGCSAEAGESGDSGSSPPTAATTAETAVETTPVETTDEQVAPSQIEIIMGAPSEFAMVPETPTVAAGRVTFVVANEGAIEHEVVLIKTKRDSGDLPTDGAGAALEDGAVAPHGGDHEAEGDHHAGVHFATGAGGEVVVDLEPGRYAVVCNLPGHYEAGMHANLEAV